MTRVPAILIAVAIVLASVPVDAVAQARRVSLPSQFSTLTVVPRGIVPGPIMSAGLSVSPPSLSLTPISAPAIVVSVTPKAHLAVINAVKAAKPQPPQAAPRMDSSAYASALFDGIPARSAASTPDPVTPVSRRELPSRFTSPLARWTGASALYSLYRDGILVQRDAARLTDPSLSPARRAASARLLASYGRIEAVPALGFAHENDSSPRVRRVAREALLRVALPAESKLVRALQTNSRPSAREAAATTLSWIVRHGASHETVEALAEAGAADSAEDVRLSAIRSLSLARSPEALPSLERMLAGETRPHMRSALELAVAEARLRRGGSPLLRAVDEDLPDTRGPLHEVALKRATAVASVFVAVALTGGIVTGSVALMADALHLAADQLLNVAALFSIWMARRPPNSRKSYGYLKVESVVGLLGSLAIAYMGYEMGSEAWRRFLEPGAAATWSVAWFALATLAANALSTAILWRHRGESLSMKGAFLHSMTDAVGSFGVIVSAAAAMLFGWGWVEPVVTAVIVAMIAQTAWGLGKPAWDLLIDAVPEGTDLDRIEAELLAIPGAAVVKDLHVWGLNSQTKALTATVLIRPGADHDTVLAAAKTLLRETHEIRHLTVQVETIPN